VNEVFLHITSLAKAAKVKRLLLAPFTMHRRIVDMIRRETKHAKEGRTARIKAKMNALVEEGVIRALQAASQAGVQIDLIVRGRVRAATRGAGLFREHPCAIDPRPLLEHHRVWYFENGGDPDVWSHRQTGWTQSVSPDRGCIPRARSRAQAARGGRRAGLYLGDNCGRVGIGARCRVDEAQARGRERAVSAQAELLERMHSRERTTDGPHSLRHCEAESGEPDLGRR